MSDIDSYVTAQPKQWAVQKQERYEQRVLLDLLRLLEDKPGQAKHVVGYAGEDFGCMWFAHNFASFPVKLSTYKAPKPIATHVLLRTPHKLPIFREMCELAANYPEDDWALVFASDGDGLPDMVIHTRGDWGVESGFWRIVLPATIEMDDMPTKQWVVDPLPGFVATLKTYSKWRLTEELLEGET